MSPTRMYVGAFVEEMRDDSIMSYCQMDLLGGGGALWVDTGHWSKAFEGYVLFLDRLLLPHLLLSPLFFFWLPYGEHLPTSTTRLYLNTVHSNKTSPPQAEISKTRSQNHLRWFDQGFFTPLQHKVVNNGVGKVCNQEIWASPFYSDK